MTGHYATMDEEGILRLYITNGDRVIRGYEFKPEGGMKIMEGEDLDERVR